jgi:hypothetical protein
VLPLLNTTNPLPPLLPDQPVDTVIEPLEPAAATPVRSCCGVALRVLCRDYICLSGSASVALPSPPAPPAPRRR